MALALIVKLFYLDGKITLIICNAISFLLITLSTMRWLTPFDSMDHYLLLKIFYITHTHTYIYILGKSFK